MENIEPKFNTLEDVERWEKENPVVVPGRVLEMIQKNKEELGNPDLTYERWKELMDSHKRMMEGDSDDDLYYQLAVLEGFKSQGDDGVESQKSLIKDKLRPCWCHSGKKYKECCGK